MMVSKSIDRPAEINDVLKVLKNANPQFLQSFESQWRSIENNKDMVHFLLKYKYEDDWAREVKENYFPITREDFLKIIADNVIAEKDRGVPMSKNEIYPPKDSYSISFHEHYILPYLKNTIKKDFNIDLKDNTHIKIILKKSGK